MGEQVVSSLQFFLDHPDSRVRLGSARTLQKLCRGYADAITHLDMRKAQSALRRVIDDVAKGVGSARAEELQQILSETLGKPDSMIDSIPAVNKIDAEIAATSSTAPVRVPTKDRGEVVIKLCEM